MAECSGLKDDCTDMKLVSDAEEPEREEIKTYYCNQKYINQNCLGLSFHQGGGCTIITERIKAQQVTIEQITKELGSCERVKQRLIREDEQWNNWYEDNK